jgi:hypothetical protein
VLTLQRVDDVGRRHVGVECCWLGADAIERGEMTVA